MTIDTEHGPARAHVHPPAGPASAALVLGHGAGRGSDTPDLLAVAARLPARGVTVVLVDQPWVVAGRRVAAPAGRLDAAWRQVLSRLNEPGQPAAGSALVVGGRSTGARVACRTAMSVGAAALLLLSFPLRPPGAAKDAERAARARAVRIEEWAAAAPLPVVLVQGERDAFGSAADVLAALGERGLARPEVVAAPGCDHGLVPRGGAVVDVAALVAGAAGRAVELAVGAGRGGARESTPG